VNSEILENIHNEFQKIILNGSLTVHSFQEAKGVLGMKGIGQKVSFTLFLFYDFTDEMYARR
jgi:hypothetical protein